MKSNEMERNMLMTNKDTILRILEIKTNRVLVIDCIKKTLPHCIEKNNLAEFEKCSEKELYNITGYQMPLELTPKQKQSAQHKYTIISAVLPFVGDDTLRAKAIKMAAENNKISPQTVK